jgi:hypothetical protein
MNKLIVSSAVLISLASCNLQDLQSLESTTAVTATVSMATHRTNVTLTALDEGQMTVAPGTYPLAYEKTVVSAAEPGATVSQTNNPGYLNIEVTDTQWPSQSFTAPATGTLAKVSLLLSAGDTTDTVEVELHAEGLPGALGASLLGTSAATTSVGDGLAWVDFDFSPPIDVTVNHVYFMVARVTQSTGGPYAPVGASWYVSSTHAYLDGHASVTTNGGASFVPLEEDTCFIAQIGGRNEVDHFTFNYNGVSSASFSSYPAGQAVIIDGGRAGILTFVPGSVAPMSNAASDEVVITE